MENQSVVSGNRFSLMLTTPVAHKIPGEQEVTGGDLLPGAGVTSIESNGYYNGERYNSADKVILETTERTGYYKLTSNGRGSVNREPVTLETTKEGFFFEEGSSEALPAASMESDNATKEYFIKKSTITNEQITPTDQELTSTISGGYYPTTRTVTVGAVTPAYPVTSVESINMPAYFYSANQNDYDIKIIPKYSNQAGYVIAHENWNNGGTEYYKIIPATATATISMETSVSSDLPNGDAKNISQSIGTKSSNEPVDGYYFKLNKTGTGSVNVSRYGWIDTGDLPSAEDHSVDYYPVETAEISQNCDVVLTPTVSIQHNNIAFSNIDNGISITATGGGSATATSAYFITQSGYIESSDSQIIRNETNSTSEQKFISSVSIPVPISGNNVFTVEVPNTTFTFTVDATGNVIVEQGD